MEVLPYADLLVIDTTNSTLFEALSVHKPAIVYGGIEKVIIGSDIQKMLKERFVYSDTAEEHIGELRKFTKEPNEYISSFQANYNDDLFLNQFINPKTHKEYFDNVINTIKC